MGVSLALQKWVGQNFGAMAIQDPLPVHFHLPTKGLHPRPIQSTVILGECTALWGECSNWIDVSIMARNARPRSLDRLYSMSVYM